MCQLQIIRNRKAARQRWTCYYCRQPMWRRDVERFARHHGLSVDLAKLLQVTAEHLRARCDGGKTIYANIAAACLFCNQRRHQLGDVLAPADYARYVRNEFRAGRWHGIVLNPIEKAP